ncbi:HemK2/MTQ2 family protein methyltransferase [Streptomyces griseocarneus]|uniref:HemK2/MTQ2 family protein methyltransferase n=1 Tax=Streptomyces griseocarneus TaxID=51201 RepID=UPI00167E35D1|nr:HemK2/MTQ2 family protein methyltransferase [Streptomyces griseocarneus]MBZ6475773.1 methyltransferase [Streptomyces griseocarneus]GHG50854.1 methyltransferase [Streptomyces griseocarneus]
MWFVTPPGVYPPQEDTWLLEAALRRERLPPGARVLDVGTGTGALALAAARQGAGQVTAVDISVRAVLTARVNGLLARRRIRAVRGDLLGPVAGQRFDLVLANPPYVPTPATGRPPRAADRPRDAGEDGRSVLDPLCARVPALLEPAGVLLIVHSALSGVARTLALLADGGLEARITDRRFVPLGPVVRARADWLRSRGLLAPGQDKEELVVIRARRTP